MTDELSRLAELYGILPHYSDIEGRRRDTEAHVALGLLRAMGIEIDCEQDAENHILRFERERAAQVVPPVLVVREDELPVRVPLRMEEPFFARPRHWRIVTENGEVFTAPFSADECIELERTIIDGWPYVSCRYPLPDLNELGYHSAALVDQHSSSPWAAEHRLSVVIAPVRCYCPDELASGRRIWGVSAQLYSLWSHPDDAVGGFSHLRAMCSLTAQAGGDVAGVSPLHAVSGRWGSECSPYGPSSRSAVNPIFLDLAQAAERLKVKKPPSGRHVSGGKSLVDYRAAAERVFTWLEEAYQQMIARPDGEPLEQFRAFAEHIDPRRRSYAVYCALQEHFSAAVMEDADWQTWPEQYRRPDSPAVVQFIKDHSERVDFFLFVEWLLEEQLRELAAHCRNQGMSVGLYLDMALGARGGGADVWMDREVYSLGAAMGAPPDSLAPQGQDWGLPPMRPDRLRECAYRPFIDAVRFNMRFAGALRIDHVMSLCRLFWVLPGNAGGAYVRYSLDDLMGIVALESRRSDCIVIGEDLGTVPDEVRQAMEERGMLSYKVLMFMKDEQGDFQPPATYPRDALVVASTHDLPTMRGFWEGRDLEVRMQLELHEPELLLQLAEQRRKDRAALADRLAAEGCAKSAESLGLPDSYTRPGAAEAFCAAAHRLIAASPCCMMIVQIEDILLQREQMNLPGTVAGHPNWRRRLAAAVEDIFEAPFTKSVLTETAERRRKSGSAQ